MEKDHEEQQEIPQSVVRFAFDSHDSGRKKRMTSGNGLVPRDQLQLEDALHDDDYLQGDNI